MKLYYDRKSKDPTYFVQIGIRNGKKVTTRNVCRIGKHSELLKEHTDPLSYAREYIKKYNESIKNDKVDISLSVDLKEKLKNNGDDVSLSTYRNIGYFYIKNLCNELGMKEYFSTISKDRKITFDMNEIAAVLIALRILDPGSKRYNAKHLHELYGIEGIEYQHIHRFLEILNEHYDDYLEMLFDNSEKIVKRNTSVCYYDCTNFYFEKEEEDEDVYDDITGELIRGFIKYGVSKEHRPNPIVEMGLFMDGDGIPLSMYLTSGNSNESITAVPAEEKMLKMFKNKSIIYCSDAGLGYANARLYNDMSGRKFIVTQSVKKLSDIYKEAVFNDCDYKYLEDDKEASLLHMQSFDKTDENNLDDYNAFIYKSFEVDKC